MHAANEYVRKRRERIRQTGRSTQTGFGRALTFDEAHAYLDRNEVIAVRLCERVRASKRPSAAGGARIDRSPARLGSCAASWQTRGPCIR